MFSFIGRKGRVKDAVKRIEGGRESIEKVLGSVDPKERAAVVVAAVRALLFDDQHERALELTRSPTANALPSVDALLALEEVFTKLGRPTEAIGMCERARTLEPKNSFVLALLASRLVSAGRASDALDLVDASHIDSLDVHYERGSALVALGRLEEALPVLVHVVNGFDRASRHSLLAESHAYYHFAKRARSLRDSVHARLYGAEHVIEADLLAGRLDGAAGVNYRLMAERLMAKSKHVPTRLQLEHPETTLDRAPMKAKADLPLDLAHRGVAHLRLRRLGEARRALVKAADLDPGCFAALRGLGAVLDVEEHGHFRRIAKLPFFKPIPEIERLVPDFPALTEQEQSVVLASVHPFRKMLPRLIELNARIVLLPIDVRTTDLPEWDKTRGERFDDKRAMDTLGGVADSHHMLAAARIESLIDIASSHGFVFAHELAHLAFFAMEDKSPIEALFERALDAPHTVTDYQLSNVHEFFAVSYEQYVRQRYDMPMYRVADDDIGIWAGITAYFDELAR